MIAKHKNQTRYKILYSKLFQLCKNRLKKIPGRKYAKMLIVVRLQVIFSPISLYLSVLGNYSQRMSITFFPLYLTNEHILVK